MAKDETQAAPQPNSDYVLTPEQTQKIIQESRKTAVQEASEIVRYPGLKMLSRFSKILGIALAIVFIVVAIVLLIIGEGWDGKFLGFFGSLGLGMLYCLLGFFLGDFCQVLVDIEENTRVRK
ncbi:MAG TPA: hypothetical protein VIT68_02805 [Candidatus Gracilibacteria bacterium]